MKDSNRIVFNTFILYGQVIIKTVFAIFYTRFVLMALGEEDYGIYAVVGGVVATLGVLTSSMSNTSMRYMAYNMGTKDSELIKKTFNTTWSIHVIIGLAVVVIMELGGWIMFEYFLDIPAEKVGDAKILFQFMIVTTYITIISVPYDAVINAHENFLPYSIMEIGGYALKMLAALYLLYFCKFNLLLTYGFLLMSIGLLLRIAKQQYSRMKYEECKISVRKYYDKTLFKQILSFTGWEFFRSFSSLCSTQLRGLLINNFFGVRLNASESIGKQVNTQVNLVSTGISRAIAPQLIKSAGEKNKEKMVYITTLGVKYTTLLFSLLAIPIIIEAPYLLKLWLKDVPQYAVIFCQLALIFQLVEKLTYQIGNAIRAVGKIKLYQTIEGTLIILTIPVSYLFFRWGFAPESIFIIEIVFGIITGCVRLYLGKKIAEINPWQFLRNATIPVLLPLLVSLVLVLPVYHYMEMGILRLLLIFLLYITFTVIQFWFFSMKNKEKEECKNIVKNILKKSIKK